MKGKDILIGTLGVVAFVFMALFFDERNSNKVLLEKNDELSDDKLKLLKESINQNNELTPEVKNQIKNLISEYESTHPKVSIELRAVLEQIQNGKEIKAIRDLANIIENLLKDKYRGESRLSKVKRLTLKP